MVIIRLWGVRRIFWVLFLFLPGMVLQAAEPLTVLEGCTLVPAEWADGDSFLVRTAEGKEMTIRLYGADCLECGKMDASDARRLREQRRYFGISGFGGSPQASIEAAKGFGDAATEEVKRVLAEPFTVYTAFADARGDGRFQRFYGFVTTSEGEDLATRLVSLGLARAFGVSRETPTGASAKEFRAFLGDVELKAAKQGLGVWEATDWDQLPLERQEERLEAEELELAIGGAKLAPGEKINPNTAARDDLMKLPGVGEVMANRIIESRPYAELEDLLGVSGIGGKTLEGLEPFVEFD